jgi:hypothetical protein
MATMPVMVAARRPAHFATGAGFLQEVNEREGEGSTHHPPSDALRMCPG